MQTRSSARLRLLRSLQETPRVRPKAGAKSSTSRKVKAEASLLQHAESLTIHPTAENSQMSMAQCTAVIGERDSKRKIHLRQRTRIHLASMHQLLLQEPSSEPQVLAPPERDRRQLLHLEKTDAHTMPIRGL